MNGLTHNTVSVLFGLCVAVLLLALLAGGGTHSGFIGDVAVELLAIPLLMAALWPAFDEEGVAKTKARMAFAVCAVCAGVVLIQLLPLPFDVWSGRSALLPDGDANRFGGARPSWSTLSVAPQATWAAALSLLVPLSIFAAVVQLTLRQRMMICWLLMVAAAASLALGFFQVAQGSESPFRFYGFTSPIEAVGFFANRNHFAAFLNVALLLSGLWLAQTMEGSLDRRALTESSLFWLAAAAAFVVAIVAGLVIARSRAGVVLAILALAGVVLMILRHSWSHNVRDRGGRKTKMSRASLAVALFAAVFSLQFGLGRLLDRFETDLADDLRFPLNVTTFETAVKALPFGTGLGSFVPVYATVEKSKDAIPSFANRAHDDLAEVFLETGLIGVALLCIFLVWFGRRFFVIWMRPKLDSHPHQALLECAASLIVVVLLLHSLVDYPLRTTALGTIFALFCGILAAPCEVHPIESPKPRRRSERPKTEAPPEPVWNNDLAWPKSWQKGPASRPDLS